MLRDIPSLILSLGFGIKLDGPTGGSNGMGFTLAKLRSGCCSRSAGLGGVRVRTGDFAARVADPAAAGFTASTAPGSDLSALELALSSEILLWQTNNNMGNAAVMGVVPQVRYILLSDLLLQTMTDRQIEAVFAHEAGHVVHRHIAWYGVFVVITMIVMMMLGELANAMHLDLSFIPPWLKDPFILAGQRVAVLRDVRHAQSLLRAAGGRVRRADDGA